MICILWRHRFESPHAFYPVYAWHVDIHQHHVGFVSRQMLQRCLGASINADTAESLRTFQKGGDGFAKLFFVVNDGDGDHVVLHTMPTRSKKAQIGWLSRVQSGIPPGNARPTRPTAGAYSPGRCKNRRPNSVSPLRWTSGRNRRRYQKSRSRNQPGGTAS